jgi:hypothetical protein
MATVSQEELREIVAAIEEATEEPDNVPDNAISAVEFARQKGWASNHAYNFLQRQVDRGRLCKGFRRAPDAAGSVRRQAFFWVAE